MTMIGATMLAVSGLEKILETKYPIAPAVKLSKKMIR